MTDEQVIHLKELVDMRLMTANRYPGHIMRRFNITYAEAEQLSKAYTEHFYFQRALKRRNRVRTKDLED